MCAPQDEVVTDEAVISGSNSDPHGEEARSVVSNRESPVTSSPSGDLV